MNCYECGKPVVKKHGDIEVYREEIGNFTVSGVIYMACDTCGSKIVFPEYADKINIKALKLHITKIMERDKKLSIFELIKKVNDNDLVNDAIDELIKESTIKEVTDSRKIRFLVYIDKNEGKENNWFKKLIKKYLK